MEPAQPSNSSMINKLTDTIKNNVPDTSQITDTIKNSIPDTTQIADTIKNTLDTAKESINSNLNEYSSQNVVSAGQDFLNTNGMIAKFVFLIFVLVVFLFFVNLGISLVGYFLQPSKNPYIIKGLIPGNSNLVISQNPNNSNSVTILRSNNESKGIEASWSIWLFINDLGLNTPGSYSHIFNKGNSVFDSEGIATVNNAPGLYLSKSDSTLRVYMDTFTNNRIFMDITNIPLKKWFHLVIRIQNNIMDAYVNGTISGRYVFNDVIKQNYDDILIGANGGFSGQLSNIVYYSRALGIYDINNIILAGPSLVQSSQLTSNLGYYSYLSNIWYTQKLNA
jgi:hypothetical protein